MSQIKFSHKYSKLLQANGKVTKHAFLLWVFTQQLALLPKDFLDYDTDYGKFKFKDKSLHIVLVFEKNKEDSLGRNLFTTIRPFTKEKWQYYKSKEGQVFDVVIVEGGRR